MHTPILVIRIFVALSILATAIALLWQPWHVQATGESVVAPSDTTIVSNTTNAALSDAFNVTGSGDVMVFVELNSSSASRLSIPTTTGLSLVAQTTSWTNQTAIRFTGSVANANAALDALTISTGPSAETAVLTVTVTAHDGLTYVPSTGHFYEEVSAGGINFSVALTAATGRTYKSRPGYLASIDSASEYDAVKSVIHSTNTTWIGLSDETIDEDYVWKGGPETGQLSNYFRWCSG